MLASDLGFMVWMFRKISARELTFITHVAAVMGFILGLAQVVFYIALKNVRNFDWDYVMLIGYFTTGLLSK